MKIFTYVMEFGAVAVIVLTVHSAGITMADWRFWIVAAMSGVIAAAAAHRESLTSKGMT